MDEHLSDTSSPPVASLEETKKLPQIITLTDPRADILSAVSQSCSIPPSEEDVQAARYMFSMLNENAVAIAAPQIGIPKRFFVMRLADNSKQMFFNPIILSRDNIRSQKEEGCLSIPGCFVKINRPRSVELEYINSSGERHTKKFIGLQARAVCHELDHLNGNTIMQHMTKHIEKETRKSSIKKKEKIMRTKKRRAKNKMARRANQHNRH
jgi:peptide deformylase